jgi:MFS family permease
MVKTNYTNNKKVPLFPILLVNFIGTLGFSIVLPFLVFLVVRFGGNAIIYGIIGAFYPLFQLIGAPILGKWSDTQGRRKILLLSQIGTAISWVLFLIALFIPVIPIINVESKYLGSFVLTIPLLIMFVSRAMDGITGGNISVAHAYIADISSEKDRKQNYGKISISANLGFIVGPALAGILGATIYGETIPVLAALIISVIAVIVIIIYLPESKTEINNKDIKQKDKVQYKKTKFKDLFKIEHIPFLMAIYFLLFLGFNIFYTSFPIHAIEGLKWSIVKLGLFLAGLSLMMAIVQGPVLGRLSKTNSDSALMLTGGVILGMNFILLVSHNDLVITLAAVCFAIGNGLMWPSFLSLLSKFAGDEHQGAVQGMGTSAGSLASIIGLILGGFLYLSINEITFVISAVVIFSVTALSLRLISMEKQRIAKKKTNL